MCNLFPDIGADTQKPDNVYLMSGFHIPNRDGGI